MDYVELTPDEVRAERRNVVVQAIVDAEMQKLARIGNPEREDVSEKNAQKAIDGAEKALARFEANETEQVFIEEQLKQTRRAFLRNAEAEHARLDERTFVGTADDSELKAQEAAVGRLQTHLRPILGEDEVPAPEKPAKK